MEKEELFYALALQAVEGIGPVRAKKLLDHFGSVRQIFEEYYRDRSGFKKLGQKILNGLNSKEIFLKAEQEMRFLENRNLLAVCFNDQAYPSKLRHCADAPLLLFQKGKFNINEKRVLSIVGTRLMTSYGRQFLQEFITDIKPFDPIIVSGLAYGIDICAHEEALRNDICTVGILAHGLDMVYPKSHERTAQRMTENGGFYTEFWSGSRAEKENFIKRNRIIAGISEATLVVESASKGGSLVTAHYASSYHRDVLAVPGRAGDKYSAGCNMLIKSNKAAMITSAMDMEYALGWTTDTAVNRTVQRKLFVELDASEKIVYEQLDSSEKKMLDQIAMDCGFSVQMTVSILLQLELKGMVLSCSGKRYQAL